MVDNTAAEQSCSCGEGVWVEQGGQEQKMQGLPGIREEEEEGGEG